MKRGEVSVKKMFLFFIGFVSIMLVLAFISIFIGAANGVYFSPPDQGDWKLSSLYYLIVFIFFMLILLLVVKLVKIERERGGNFEIMSTE